MTKIVDSKIAVINPLQLATLNEIVELANDNGGYVSVAKIEPVYKMNVVNALVRRGIIAKRSRGYRVMPIETKLLTRKHRPTSRAGIAYAAALATEG